MQLRPHPQQYRITQRSLLTFKDYGFSFGITRLRISDDLNSHVLESKYSFELWGGTYIIVVSILRTSIPWYFWWERCFNACCARALHTSFGQSLSYLFTIKSTARTLNTCFLKAWWGTIKSTARTLHVIIDSHRMRMSMLPKTWIIRCTMKRARLNGRRKFCSVPDLVGDPDDLPDTCSCSCKCQGPFVFYLGVTPLK